MGEARNFIRITTGNEKEFVIPVDRIVEVKRVTGKHVWHKYDRSCKFEISNGEDAYEMIRLTYYKTVDGYEVTTEYLDIRSLEALISKGLTIT